MKMHGHVHVLVLEREAMRPAGGLAQPFANLLVLALQQPDVTR